MIDLKLVFESFATKKVIVVGDVMLDTYIKGKVSRISPEAPVPVVKFESKENRLGGAANVALNIKALGAKPYICSVIGDDDNAKIFEQLVNDFHLPKNGIIYSDERSTTEKTRVIGNNQQLLRVDNEEISPLSSKLEYNLVERIKEICRQEQIDAIILQDYNKGVLTPKVISDIVHFANENNIPTAVDPKKENFFDYKNVTLFKPNLKELKEGLDIEFNYSPTDKAAFLNAVKALKDKINSKYTFITLSEFGVYINNDENDYFISAHLRNITDVSGAGDTVISVATLCLASDLKPELIAEISNLAGGLVCEKVGVISIDKEQLMQESLNL